MSKLIFIIKYIVVKIVARYISYMMKGKKVAPGIIYHNRIAKFDKIVFLLKNSSYIHLGDQFFWAPAILAVNNSSEYNLEVLLPGNMNEFWECNGIENSTSVSEESEGTLFITDAPIALSKEFKKRSYIAIDLSDECISDRVSVYLCNEICKLLKIKIDAVPLFHLPQKIEMSLKEKIEKLGDNVWLLSDTVTACPWRFPYFKRKKIWEKAKEIVDSGGKIIYVQEDNTLTSDVEEFSNLISLDLRGITKPDDILAILQMSNILGTISFDNFLMHTALLCDKKAFVAFRGRYYKRQKRHCYEKVNTAFSNIDVANIDYL